MGLISILVWVIYGVVVGLVASFLYRKLTGTSDTPVGWAAMILLGIAGSFIGGFINWIAGWGSDPIQPSGFLMGVCGGVCALVIYKYLSAK